MSRNVNCGGMSHVPGLGMLGRLAHSGQEKEWEEDGEGGGGWRRWEEDGEGGRRTVRVGGEW